MIISLLKHLIVFIHVTKRPANNPLIVWPLSGFKLLTLNDSTLKEKKPTYILFPYLYVCTMYILFIQNKLRPLPNLSFSDGWI